MPTGRCSHVRSSAIDDIERSYAAADADLHEKISFIAAAHDADLDAARKLEQGYESLDTMQKEYVALCRNASATDEQIAAFVNNTIDPAVNGPPSAYKLGHLGRVRPRRWGSSTTW